MIDFAPAFVAADQIGFDGDGAGALRRNDIDDVVLHFVAGIRGDFFGADIDLLDLLRRAIFDIRFVFLEYHFEQSGLGDDIFVGVEDEELGLRFLGLVDTKPIIDARSYGPGGQR